MAATASTASSPAVLTLSRDEMRNRALVFSKRWKGHQREEADAKSFLDEFFDIFGRNRRAIDAIHEYRVERADQGEGRIDLLWPGKLLVEMKSTGRDLSTEKGGAAYQAFEYIPHLDPEARPRWVLVSDFARFSLYDLGEEIHDYLKGFVPARSGKRAPAPVAVFTLDDDHAEEIDSQSVALEKSLQKLIEKHLETLLGVRFLATEHSTGAKHGGRS